MRSEFERNPQRYREVAALFLAVAGWLRAASGRPGRHSLLGI
jgi:hypothetical protein